ncbi:TetR/AcrR family transcriptional regulator [Streptacidiphilus monticola]
MGVPAKRRSYHHGELRAALVDTAVELIAERGVHAFSLAEAARRLGVTVAAPYRHFADRGDLLAAVAVRATEALAARLRTLPDRLPPEERLVDAAEAYVRFAAEERALFDALFAAGVDKARHPELAAATDGVLAVLAEPALALSDGDRERAETLVLSLAAAAHGSAALLLDGGLCQDPEAVDHAVRKAGRWPGP